MTTPERSTDGFALPAAVFALVVVGVLVTGGFYIARQESRIGVANEHATRAFYLAETGISEVVSEADLDMLGSIPLWGDTVVADTVADGIWEVSVTRMTPRAFFLDGTGRLTRGGGVLGGANRRVGMIVKMFTAVIDPPAALSTQGNLWLGGSSEIMGQDSIPGQWAGLCDPADLTDKAGILIDDTTNITYSGNNYEVDGDPGIQEDPNLTIDSLLKFGDLTFDDLVKFASIEFLSSQTITNTEPDSMFVSGEWVCDTSSKYNWGDPLNPGAACGSYFPIIYAHNNLNINSSGSGQGIMLIEGDLNLQGGYKFFGPVIVKGTLSTQGTGGHVNGGVIAANVNLDTSTVLGNALVQYSSCTVMRAILNNDDLTKMRPLAQRSWVDLTNVGAN